MRRIEVLEICFGYVDGFCMSIRVGYYCICGLSYCYTLRYVWMKGFGLEDLFFFDYQIYFKIWTSPFKAILSELFKIQFPNIYPKQCCHISAMADIGGGFLAFCHVANFVKDGDAMTSSFGHSGAICQPVLRVFSSLPWSPIDDTDPMICL